MRYYTTHALQVTTLRKSGFYPSTTVAKKLATKVCWVIGSENCPDLVQAISHCLSHGYPIAKGSSTVPEGTVSYSTDMADENRSTDVDFWGDRLLVLNLCPSEQRIVQELGLWWSAEEAEEWYAQKAFIALNLNTGRSLCITDRR